MSLVGKVFEIYSSVKFLYKIILVFTSVLLENKIHDSSDTHRILFSILFNLQLPAKVRVEDGLCAHQILTDRYPEITIDSCSESYWPDTSAGSYTHVLCKSSICLYQGRCLSWTTPHPPEKGVLNSLTLYLEHFEGYTKRVPTISLVNLGIGNKSSWSLFRFTEDNRRLLIVTTTNNPIISSLNH